MNYWAINKDNSIKCALLVLEDRFGPDTFDLSSRWDQDKKAVGLFQPGAEAILAYIYTHGQSSGKYGLHLEYPGPDGNPAANLTEMSENIDLDHMIDLLAVHFNIVS
jgi:hypothetical protein